MSELSFVVCIIDQAVGILQSFPPEWIQSILGWQLPLLKAIFISFLKFSYSTEHLLWGQAQPHHK